jgi:acyl-CoA synthetase (NDP forming)
VADFDLNHADVSRQAMSALLDPQSIAVVGASSDPAKPGGRALAYLQRFHFAGPIYAVNPNLRTGTGIRVLPRLEDIDSPVDLCILATPASAVEHAMQQCAAMGIKAAIVFASGFAESSEPGRQLQTRLRQIAEGAGIALAGPNSLGLINFATGAAATFTTALQEVQELRKGSIALVSQSGALAALVLHRMIQRGLGLSHLVVTGNESLVGFSDYIQWLLEDEATRVIAGYLEGTAGAPLLRAAKEARAHGKQLIIMKVGASAEGATAALAHTGSLAGSDQVYQAIFDQHGILRANNLDELIDFSVVCSAGLRPYRPDVGIVSLSGGAGILMADRCARTGLKLATLSPHTRAVLRDTLPIYAAPRNPVDVTGRPLWDADLLRHSLEAVSGDDAVGVVLCHVGIAGSAASRIATEILSAYQLAPKPLLVSWADEGGCTAKAQLSSAGVPVLDDPVKVVEAAKALVTSSLGRLAPHVTPRPRQAATPPTPRGSVVTEHAAARWLAAIDVESPPSEIVTDAHAAVHAAETLGYPVCLKLLSRDVLHRSDIGAVKLNLRDGEDVWQAFAEVQAALTRIEPSPAVDGFLVASQLDGGYELIVSTFQDKVFGPCVMCGTGGVAAELYADRVIRTAPVTESDAREMINQTKGGARMFNRDGTPRYDIAAAAAIISRVSKIWEQPGQDISLIEINPLLVFPVGAVAADALILR